MKRAVFLVFLGLIIILSALMVNHWYDRTDPPTGAPLATPVASAVAPGFDVLRIDAGGKGIIIGHAMPHQNIALHIDGDFYQSAIADQRGEWVITLGVPLGPGNHELMLHVPGPSGKLVAAAETAVVNVPALQESDDKLPLAVVLPEKNSAAQDLSSPIPQVGEDDSAEAAAPDQESDILPLRINEVRPAAEAGVLVISGYAQPGAVLQIDLAPMEPRKIAVDGAGTWQVDVPQILDGRDYGTLIVNRLDANGLAVETMEAVIQWQPDIRLMPIGTRLVVIKPGQSLWQLAAQYYGDGRRADIIVAANARLIAKADRIKPGMVLILPVLTPPR